MTPRVASSGGRLSARDAVTMWGGTAAAGVLTPGSTPLIKQQVRRTGATPLIDDNQALCAPIESTSLAVGFRGRSRLQSQQGPPLR